MEYAEIAEETRKVTFGIKGKNKLYINKNLSIR